MNKTRAFPKVAINDIQVQAGSKPVFGGSELSQSMDPFGRNDVDLTQVQRVVKPLGEQSLWAVLDSASEDDSLFVWRDQDARFSFVAVGEVLRFDSQGGSRFEELQAWSSRVFEQLGSVAPELPCVVGGFSFSEFQRSSDSCWANWQDVRFVLPEKIAYRRRLASGKYESGLILHELESEETRREKMVFSLSQNDFSTTEPELFVKNLQEDQARFEDLVRRALDGIGQGMFRKVVAARAALMTPKSGYELDPVASLKTVCTGDDRSIGFALSQPGSGMFMGLSPEVLLRVEGGRLTTHAVAGTTARGQNDAEDQEFGAALMKSAKDLHEHRLVVQGIQEALMPLCDDLSSDPEPGLVRLTTVQHLSTAIRARLKPDYSVLTAISRLHPTPALCGSPTVDALSWLAENEVFERGWYGAPVGWLAAGGDSTFAVSIRSALLRDGLVHAFGGAGIVEGSDPASEWKETELKIAAVARLIQTREKGDA